MCQNAYVTTTSSSGASCSYNVQNTPLRCRTSSSCFSGGREPLPVLDRLLWTGAGQRAGDGRGAGRGSPPGESAARLAHTALVRPHVDVPVRDDAQARAGLAVSTRSRPLRSGICRSPLGRAASPPLSPPLTGFIACSSDP